MLLYYSGATEAFRPQKDPSLSLGGYISSSFVPNDVLNSLFGSVFVFEIDKNKPSTKLLVLRNSLPADVTGVRIWTETPEDSLVTYKVGLADPMYDSCSKEFFEYLQQEDSLPFYAELEAHEGETQATTTFNLEKGKYKGIWIRREIKELPADHPAIQINTQVGFDFDGDKLVEAVLALEALDQKEENVKLIIDWV